MITDPTFLDVNVFMYAAGRPHPYKQPGVRILADFEATLFPGVIDTEIIQEILYRYSHIGLPEQGVQLSRAILEYPLAVLPVTDADIRTAIGLFELHHTQGITPRDAIHAAVMRNNGIACVISADGDFDRFGFLTRIDPLVYPSGL